MTAPHTAMVLAAGFGTRMGDLTRSTPKPLLKAGGRALLDHALDRVAEAGIGRAVVNLHYLGEQIRTHLASRTQPKIVFSPEETLLDTGGGVVAARSLLGDAPFPIINSDAVWSGPPPIGQLLAHWNPDRMDALLQMIPVEKALAYTRDGDFFLSDDGKPVRRGAAANAPYIYTGAQVICPRLLDGAPEGAFSMNLLWDRALASGRVAACVYDGRWIDVGAPAGLASADRLLSGKV